MVVKRILDGWSNIITGLGGSKDQNTHSYVNWTRMNRGVTDSLLASDDIAAKICNMIPYDATREGVTWKIAESDAYEDVSEVSKILNEEFERLEVFKKFRQAWSNARASGGACVLLVVDDSKELWEPLEIKRVRQINALHILDRWDFSISSSDIIDDINSPLYGTPEIYTYFQNGANSSSSLKIHHSRLIRFDGAHLPINLYKNNNYWHDSIFTKLYRPVRNYSTTHDNAATVTGQLNVPVFKIEGLNEAVSQDEDELVLKKLQLVNQMRSSMNALVLDKEDEFQNLQVALTGAKDLVDVTTRRLIAASDIPHTRLLGEGPSGALVGDQGKSEMIDYYDMVKSRQEDTLRKPIDRMAQIIFNQLLLPIQEPESWTFTFDPLYQQDQKTVLETRKIQADIDSIYMTQGVYDSFEVANSRFGSGEFSYETSLDLDEKSEKMAFEGEEIGESEESEESERSEESEEAEEDADISAS